MKSAVVVDTNVPIVANGKSDQAGMECEMACIDRLEVVRDQYRVVIDSLGQIMKEYRKYLSPSGQPGPGDVFYKWLWDNRTNQEVCRQVAITPSGVGDGNFAEFPQDPELAAFHHKDRKFVAVILASGEHAPVINATDTDWWHFREALARHDVEVEFICPELMVRSRHGRRRQHGNH